MKDELLELLKKYAYKKGEFKLSSGKSSEHYVNCKPVVLTPRGLTLASVMLLSQVEQDAVAVGGLTLGADPLVSGVTVICGLDNINLSGLIVRKKAKGHGTQSWIEGPELPKGSLVTVLEDVITTGGSSIEAVKRIRDVGYKVNRVVSIIDRQENGEADAAMKWADLELVSLYKLEELI